MEQVKQILLHYGLGDQDVLNRESHSHDPDMWSETFEVDGKKYILIEVEAVGDDLLDEEYARLETDLHVKRTDLKLIMPKLGQAHAVGSKASIGIDHSDTTSVLFEVQVTTNSNLLTEDEAQKVEWGETLDKEYFYVPVIYYSESTPIDEEHWYSLRFNNQEPPASLMFYASKVPAGKTLWQAVRHDLETDFKYPHEKSFVIEGAKPFDTAKTKDGRELTRFFVWVGVYEKFDVTGINPVGTKPFWFYEGENVFNVIANKYFGSRYDSELTEPVALPFGKYLDPNKLGELKVLKHATINPHEPEDLYLIQDTGNDDLYCCYDFQDHMGGGPFEDPQYIMRTFLSGNIGAPDEFSIEMLEPKNKDWFVTCYIARIHKKAKP